MEELIKWEGDYIIHSQLVGEYETKLPTEVREYTVIKHNLSSVDLFQVLEVRSGEFYGTYFTY